MDTKLDEYRTRKRREATVNNIKSKLFNMIPFHHQPQQQQQQAPTAGEQHHVSTAGGEATVTAAKAEPKTKPIAPSAPPLDSSDADDDTVLPFTDSDDDDDEKMRAAKAQAASARPPRDYLTYVKWLVYLLLWITCWAIAIELQFGLVYLLMSGIAGVYLNTRTGPRRAREVSAYSVFNRDCRAIDGTLNAEQFEREIRYGPAGVR